MTPIGYNPEAKRLRLDQTVRALAEAGPHGLTWSELASTYGWHHGQASAALSDAHRAGRIACLQDRRNGSHVYVLPEHVGDDATRPYGRRNQTAEADMKTAYDAGYSDGWNALRDMQRGY
jgi:uncharacterized protein YcaQ